MFSRFVYIYIYDLYIYIERENFNIEKWEDKKQTHPCQIKAYAAKSSIEHRYVLNDLERGAGFGWCAARSFDCKTSYDS